jgi:hypothetical protein
MARFPDVPGPAARRLAAASICVCAFTAACDMPGGVSLTQLLEARRLVSELHIQFTKAVDAANLAVMADTDDASASAARQSEQAIHAASQALDQLHPILKGLGYNDELRAVDAFGARFDDYKKLDAEILPLAVENTNLKAQRLSFGPAREAGDAIHQSLDTAVRSAAAKDTCRAEALAARASAAVLDIRVLEAPHIAESEDAAMTKMEGQMAASEASARTAIEQLKSIVGPAGRPAVDSAASALDRFKSVNAEIVALSRRNSNVRSLALSLGRKRKLVADCDDQLRALSEALAKHPFPATR